MYKFFEYIKSFLYANISNIIMQLTLFFCTSIEFLFEYINVLCSPEALLGSDLLRRAGEEPGLLHVQQLLDGQHHPLAPGLAVQLLLVAQRQAEAQVHVGAGGGGGTVTFLKNALEMCLLKNVKAIEKRKCVLCEVK